MEDSEYKTKLKLIDADYALAKRKLQVECAHRNEICSVGDIITNNIFTIIVDKILAYVNVDGVPEPVYTGQELTKTLVPKKSKERGAIYGNNNVRILKPKV